MKNVYTQTVNPYGEMKKDAVAKKAAAPKMRLRGVVTVIISLLFLFNTNILVAQNCPTSGTDLLTANENTYYPGTTTVAAGSTSITLGAIGSGTNFGNTPIAVGDIVLVIQIQGAQFYLPPTTTNSLYGANSSGVSSGMITTNLVAGQMEFAVATNTVAVGGGTLNISAGLTNSYTSLPYTSTSGKYTYQVIRVPQHFNIQLGATITAPNWNGSTGGVTVISAVNQFDFNGQTVSAKGAGFRGGGGRNLSGQSGLNKYDLYEVSTVNAGASKAEGIGGTPRYVTFNNALLDNGAANEGYPGGSYTRGGIANAGGGAADSDPASNDQNAGGGGGGNGGAGGIGGNGWQTAGVTGGFGGTRFQTYGPVVKYYSPSRLILGGGGGAGSTNNGSGTPASGAASGGASGGGLIIINSTTIIGTGIVNASGNTGNSTVTVDGSGGGGAGGSILIYANSGQAGITAIANGGDGATNNPVLSGATQHGPGGGGGGGVIYSNAALNVASAVAFGIAGISNGTTTVGSLNYGATNGTVGSITTTFPFSQLPPNMQICQTVVLPVTILSFSANYVSNNNVKVNWSTTNEINASYFVVERSSNGADFTDVATVNASESINPIHDYTVNDQLYNVNSNVVYYRLRIVDKDGKYNYSKIIPVKLDQPESTISVYPNPVDNYVVVNLYSDKPGTGILRLVDDAGRQILTKTFTVVNGNNNFIVDQLGPLQRGIYVIQLMVNNNLYNQKIVKK